jgi:antibiotic biosynthesis monooxygenase (ABM) superfamily enzyme
MSDTITLVRLRLQEGKTSAEWLRVNEKINEWVTRQPGFRFRSLSETEDAEWIIMSSWDSLDAAIAADKSFGEEMMGMCKPLIANESIVVSRSKAHLMQRG